MGIDERMLIIRRNDFLAQLTREEYELLNIMHNFIIADKNAYIYFDPQYHSKLYFIKEGYVKIGTVDDDGNEIVKEILQPGDLFGQFTLEPKNMQGEFAQAHRSGAILCAFTIDSFHRLLQMRPDMAIHFSKKIGQKLKKVECRLTNLLQKDARTRILYFFWSLIPQNNSSNSITIENYLTHEDIARLTGTSRQTVTTFLNQFADEGLLTVDRQLVNIHDVKLLQKEAKVG